MRLFDWLWRSGSRREPEADPRLAQLVDQEEKVRAYLRERSVPYKLEKEEIPFAVITPIRSENQSLRELGDLLLAWKAMNKGVKRILGLERLLEGKHPEVSVHLLMIPFYPAKPETCVERVALVVVDASTNQELLAAGLCDLIERNGSARVFSWEQYSYMNR